MVLPVDTLLIVLMGIAWPVLGAPYYGELVGSLKTNAHLVSGDIYIVDTTRIQIRNFNYDGTGPDAFFYVGTSGSSPSGNGITIPNEKGSIEVLSIYNNANIILTLPGNIQMKDIEWFSVWCVAFSVNFGSLSFSSDLIIPAPQEVGQFTRKAHGVHSGTVTILDAKTIRIADLNYDGAGPDAYFLTGSGPVHHSSATKVPNEEGSTGILSGYNGQTITLTLPDDLTFYDVDYLSMYCIRFTQNFGDVAIPDDLHVPAVVEPVSVDTLPNCETMGDYMNVAWEMEDNSIILELSGALDGDDGYMAFGISGDTAMSKMLNADVVVTRFSGGTPKAEDYHLNGYSLCAGGGGACPDISSGGVEDWTILKSDKINGVTTIRAKRLLDTGDAKDIPFTNFSETWIVWAMGRVNDFEMVTKHDLRLVGNKMIEFGRAPSQSCSAVKERNPKTYTPWEPAMLSGMTTNTFRAQIGPAGGPRGYTPITGQQSWGIAWYINQLLIPEIYVLRGETYTFIVEGGEDQSNSAEYHPFYITDDKIGGYSKKTDEQKKGITVYAGPAEGRYCEWKHKSIDMAKESERFEDYFGTLQLDCVDGNPGNFTWTPDNSTADLVYYQCWTHNSLGWKIHVQSADRNPDLDGVKKDPSGSDSKAGSSTETEAEPEPSPGVDSDIDLGSNINSEKNSVSGLATSANPIIILTLILIFIQ